MDRMEQLKKWLEENPSDPFLHYAIATEHVAGDNDEEAEKIFTLLVREHPTYFATYYHYGMLMERRGDEDAAISIYKKGMEVTRELGEQHAYNELRSVLEELEF